MLGWLLNLGFAGGLVVDLHTIAPNIRCDFVAIESRIDFVAAETRTDIVAPENRTDG